MSLAQVEATTEAAQVGEEGGSLRKDAWRRLLGEWAGRERMIN